VLPRRNGKISQKNPKACPNFAYRSPTNNTIHQSKLIYMALENVNTTTLLFKTFVNRAYCKNQYIKPKLYAMAYTHNK
jgi:hypothetical protein